jgi:hypothetical protein
MISARSVLGGRSCKAKALCGPKFIHTILCLNRMDMQHNLYYKINEGKKYVVAQ